MDTTGRKGVLMAGRNGVESWGTVRAVSYPWDPVSDNVQDRDTIPDLIWDDETQPEIEMKTVKIVRSTLLNAIRTWGAKRLLHWGFAKLAWRVAP